MDLLQGLKPLTLEKSHSQERPTVLPMFNSSPEDESRNSSPSPVSKLLEELSLDCSITDETPDSAVLNGKEDQSYFLLNGKETEEGQESLQNLPKSSPVKQKPPAVSKKPKLSSLPPFNSPQINGQGLGHYEDPASLSHVEDQVDGRQRLTKEEGKEMKKEQQEEEEISESSEPLTEISEASSEIQDEPLISAPAASQETNLDHGLCTNGEAQEEDDEEGDGASSTTGSISSKEDDAGKSDELTKSISSPNYSKKSALCREWTFIFSQNLHLLFSPGHYHSCT